MDSAERCLGGVRWIILHNLPDTPSGIFEHKEAKGGLVKLGDCIGWQKAEASLYQRSDSAVYLQVN